MVHSLREQAVTLREKGLSYSEIRDRLGIARSTLSYMLKDIVLTEKQKKRLEKKKKDGQKVLRAWSETQPPEVLAAVSSRGGKVCQERHSEALRKHLSLGWKAAMLTYRKDELPIKISLEKIYNRVFSKELIGRRAIDFACKDLLIEHTSDPTHGVFDLVRRFEDVVSDPRKKIAYLDVSKIGPSTRKRLENLGVLVLDFRALA